MKNGTVHLNGSPLVQEPVTTLFKHETTANLTFHREQLPNGPSYVIANSSDEGLVDGTEEFIVPPGHYFVLGDNRDNSQDSRFLDVVGYVPRKNFVGNLLFRVWNSQGVPISGRPQ